MSSSPSDSSSTPSNSSSSSKRPIDPVLRNALRYTVSAKEYKLLHDYLISKSAAVEKRAPKPKRYEALVKSTEDYNVATVRVSLRVFIAAFTGLKGWEFLSKKLLERKQKATRSKLPVAPANSSALRISASFSLILLFHRLLHRFFIRLRASLLEESAKAFRYRNPRITEALTSRFTPILGASLAGFWLQLCPKSQMRMTIAIYMFTRSLEFSYNAAEEKGIWGKRGKPDWVGSWMIMPLAYGQLLHSFVFDRDCFPSGFSEFILKRSPEYIQTRPAGLPAYAKWPGTFDIVDALAQLSRLKWPAFTSPILFPQKEHPLPISLSSIAPITGSAHPLIQHTSCALLHPSDPSCARTYLKYFLSAFPTTARFFTAFYGAFALLSYKAFLANPAQTLNRLASRILRMTLFITGAVGTSWGSICLFANYLPKGFLSTQRWFLGGLLGGMWAYVARRGERSNFLYCARLSIDSLWKVGVKHGWWKGFKSGDVFVFVASLALLNIVYEARPRAVRGSVIRKGLGVVRGDGWVDRVVTVGAATEKKADDVEKEILEKSEEIVEESKEIIERSEELRKDE